MPIYRNNPAENPLKEEELDIPESIMSRAKEKDVLKWLYKNAAQYEQKYGLPKGVLLALAGHESAHYQRSVASGTGPKGLFQLAEKTARGLGLTVSKAIDERLDLDKATDAAARLLRERLNANKGDVLKSLAQYNGGIEAAKWVDGRTHQYDTGNGNPGELYGFLRGVANYAKEWGNNELYDTLHPAFKDRAEEIVQIKKEMKAKGYDVAEDSSWSKKMQAMYDEYQGKVKEESKPIFMKTMGEELKPITNLVEKLPDHTPPPPPEPVAKTEEKPVEKKFVTDRPFKQAAPKRDPKEIRIYEEGGKLKQTAEGAEDVELEGEERVYSIPDTKAIVKMATAAKSEEDLIALGKFIYKATKKQDEREPEYTED